MNIWNNLQKLNCILIIKKLMKFWMVQLQLQSLMDTLNSTEPHYIRCVKPNNQLKPAIFENVNIMQQLRCGVSMLLCSSFISLFGRWFIQKYIHSFIKSSPLLQLFLTLVPIGCFGGNQNQLCWLPYSPCFLWIYKQIWHPCYRGHGSKVSTLLVYLLCLGGRKVLAWYAQIFRTKLGDGANMSKFSPVSSCDEKAGCQKILEKMGLHGYQVIWNISPA